MNFGPVFIVNSLNGVLILRRDASKDGCIKKYKTEVKFWAVLGSRGFRKNNCQNYTTFRGGSFVQKV